MLKRLTYSRVLLPAGLVLAAFFPAACSRLGWGRHPSQQVSSPDGEYEVGASSGPLRRHPEEDIPEVEAAARDIRYYADLGPDAVDVSEYPTQQKYNYAIYAKACSACHTLARSINAPVASRGFWEMYLLGMRAASRLEKRKPLTQDERTAILDFLEYDSRVRKVESKREFEAITQELKRRYDPFLRDRLRRLQESPRPAIIEDRNR